MNSIQKNQKHKISLMWLDYFKNNNIDVTNNYTINQFYFDDKCSQYFKTYGLPKFKKLAIWGTQWVSLSNKYDLNKYDPRSYIDKIIHIYLNNSQYYSKNMFIRTIDFFLKKVY